MWKLGLVVAGLTALSLCAGCGKHSHGVVGKWTIQGGPTPATMTFGTDGKFRTDAADSNSRSSVTGDYRQEGDTLKIGNIQPRTGTIQWRSDDEMLLTGDDGRAMTLTRVK